jgi:magnesium transporter
MVSEDAAVQATARRITALIEGGAARRARLLLVQLHPADQADVLEELDEDVRRILAETLADGEFAAVLEYLREDTRLELIEELPQERLLTVLDRIEDDLAADIIQNLPEELAQVALSRSDDKLEELVQYEEESAGGRMSADIIQMHDFWTVGRGIEYLRRQPIEVRQQPYLFVIDDYDQLVGTLTPSHLVMYPGQMRLDQIMERDPITVPVDYDQEEAAERMRHYNLLFLPVVDEEGRVRGVLTADDILDIQVEEATEDIYHLGGLTEEERIFRPVRQSIPPRLAWLSFNLATAFVGATIINFFEGTIERVATLAVFMPLVAGMAGNAGLQTLTLVVRSIALGEVEPRDAARVLKHELLIAVVNGLLIGAFVGLIAWLWKESHWLGVIVSTALLLNIANAMIVGVLVQMTLRRLKRDPALASGVIVMVADAFGFLLLLGLATLVITELE